MALSRLSNMQGITQAFTTPARPTALSMMGAREERENAAKLAEYEAMTKRGTMMEKMAAGQATRATEAETALAFKSLPEVTAEVGTTEWLTQIQEQLRAAQNSGNPELQKWAITGYAQLDQVRKSAPIQEGTQSGDLAQSEINRRSAESQKNIAEAGRKTPYQGLADPPDVVAQWARAVVEGSDPNTKGWNMWKPNRGEDEKAKLVAELMMIYDQVRKEYINTYGYEGRPEDIQSAALRRHEAQMGKKSNGGDTKIPPVPETLPPNTPMNTTTRSGRVIDGRR